MAGLYSQLFVGSSAMAAQRTGVSAAGHNIANVNTPGHTRVGIDLRAENAFIGGVRSMGFTSGAELILHQRERLADADMGRATDMANAAVSLEGDLALEGGSIVDAIAALFGGIVELSSSPTDIALRGGVVSQAAGVASNFNRSARAIADARNTADDRIDSLTREATSLAAEIASANEVLRTTVDSTVVDQRNQAARELSQIVGGTAHIDSRGSMRFMLEDGTVLVDDVYSATLSASPDPANYGGHMRVDVSLQGRVRDVTTSLTSGRVGAQLDFRDNATAQMMSDLDQLAFDISSQLNAVHRTFAGMDGASGRDFFTQPAVVQGAASAMAVDPTIIADPTLLANADPALGTGDNSGLIALAALRDQPLAGSGSSQTFVDEGLRMMTSLGFMVQDAKADQDIAALRVDSLASMRDSLTGVSVEEELTRLQGFQRASEASARVLQTVDSLLGNLIEML